MARPIIRDSPRWSRQEIRQLVLPAMPQLQGTAMMEVRSALASWRRDPRMQRATFDAARFERLQEIIENRLKRLLAKRSRRMLFNIVRGLTPEELRSLCGIADIDADGSSQVLIEATRAVCWYTRPAGRERAEGQPIILTVREREERTDLPAVVACTVALAGLTVAATDSYRRTGKGARLVLDSAGLPQIADPPLLGWVWESDDALEAAMAEYDARRRVYHWTPVGMPVRRTPNVDDESPIFWVSVGRASVPVTVSYALLGREHVTHGFLFRYENIAPRLDHIDGKDHELRQQFDLTADAFRRMCVALSTLLHRNLALGNLTEADAGDETVRLDSDLADTTSLAPDFLHELLCEGVVRAPRQTWIDQLSRLGGKDEVVTPTEASTFVDAFTDQRGPVIRDLKPRLFRAIENGMLVLDLAGAEEFVDLCYRSLITGVSGESGKDRGGEFEVVARNELATRLGLRPPYPVPPGYKLTDAGLVKAEVDFCFWWRGVLVHMDMKAMTRGLDIHRGAYKPTRNRLSRLENYLVEQVEARAEPLARLLRARGEHCDIVVNLLCTADVEYIPPGPRLRYGHVPRVMTAHELADLLLDEERWAELVTAAKLRKKTAPGMA